MKKLVLCLILGILLVSFIGLGVLAEENDTDNNNNESLSCDSENLDLCLDETNCTDAGGYWYGDVCNEEEGEDDETGQGNQVKTRGEKRTTFTPWQKRNESAECLDGCKCVGAVVSCPTGTGKIMTIEAGRSGNVITITVDKIEVNTTLELEQEEEGENRTKLKAKLSNGRKAEIKIMPDTASEIALERLRFKLRVCSAENNCTIELKEVGKRNETKAAYEIQAQRHAKLLGLFRKKMQVKAQIDAETGEIIRVKKPWWAFLASEPEE